MTIKLETELFTEHHADAFPLIQIIEFMNDKAISYDTWSSQMECDFCNFNALEYFREQEVYYNKESGFSLETKTIGNDYCLDFSIYRCPQCGKWFTYIE